MTKSQLIMYCSFDIQVVLKHDTLQSVIVICRIKTKGNHDNRSWSQETPLWVVDNYNSRGQSQVLWSKRFGQKEIDIKGFRLSNITIDLSVCSCMFSYDNLPLLQYTSPD